MYAIFCVYGQKRAPDPITDGCEPPCGCWELNSGPLEEQAMLLTSEPSLQPCCFVFETRFHVAQDSPPIHSVAKDDSELLILLPLPPVGVISY